MKNDILIWLLYLASVVFFLISGFTIGFYLGKDKGYDQALADIKAITPAPKTTDQQCVAWLFETNMRAVKNRICK